MDSKVITGELRLSYEHLNTPVKNDRDEDIYSVSLLIPKSDTKTIEAIKAAIKVAAEEGKSKFGGIIPKGLKYPLHDGDTEKEAPEYEGHMYVNASSYRKPTIIDRNGKPIILATEIYSGCYARAIISFRAFNNQSKGIRCQLEAVQKLRDGEPFGNTGMSAEAAASAFGVAPAQTDAGGIDEDMPEWMA